jgi:NAD(P)-dependent dehydrogenase (short-subunit alcohol dehydrogenase family)
VKDLAGKVAVVTGGASGIGKGIVEALLDEEATVVIADIEKGALDATVDSLSAKGPVSGIVTDVADPDSVEECAKEVYRRHGACHLLFANAGVGGGGVAKPWNWTHNDWAWCIGVNVLGVGHCVSSFVPRMIEGGEDGWVVTTSSSNGGFQPLPDLGIYAASKAAVTTFTEALAKALADNETRLGASVFYPGGNGVMETNLWNSGRNRPADLEREHPHLDQQWDYQDYKKTMEDAGVQVADLVELGQVALQGIREGRFTIGLGTETSGELLRQRAERIGRGELPTVSTGSAFE